MIRRINLWGGPASGKSTTAALVFSRLKAASVNAELVTEYVKAWAYEKRKFELFDQVYIFAKQQRLEDRVLRAAVDILVTDSPLLMQCVYARKFNCPYWKELLKIGLLFNEEYPCKNILLQRYPGAYQQHGRYQTADEAVVVDGEIKSFLNEFSIPFVEIDNNHLTADSIISSIPVKLPYVEQLL